MMAARKGKQLSKVKMKIRVMPARDPRGWVEVDAYIVRRAGMLFGIHRTAFGSKRWTVSEWLTGLKVCEADTHDSAEGQLVKNLAAAAKTVQKCWNEEAHGTPSGPYGEWMFKPCLNEMHRSAYEALRAGEFGKAAL